MCPKVSEKYKREKTAFILKGAKMVFIRKGFEAATMQDIVDECGISRGSLYMYFSSTTEIFIKLMEVDAKQDETLNDFKEQNIAAIEILMSFLKSQKADLLNIRNTLIPTAYEFFIKESRNMESKKIVQQRYDDALERVKKVIDYGIDRREFSSKVESRDVSRHIVVFMEGLITTALAMDLDENIIDRQIEIFSDFLKGLLLIK